MPLADHIQHSLRRAINEKHLAVLCGAGISMAPPSSLPSWWEVNFILLKEICSVARTYLPSDLWPDIDSLDIKNIRIQSLSEEIVNIVAGRSYFTNLQRLDGQRTNPNHDALASLAQAGSLRAIVSTNFDTLIERAFRERGVPLKTYVYTKDYVDPFPDDTCVLLKVHGSADDPDTLIDTVSQKLSGLPEIVRRRVSEIAADNHVLVLGFSGADLEFAEDYLTLNPAGLDWRGISWLKRREDNLRDEAFFAILRTATGAAQRAEVLLGDLPKFFNDLGIDVTESPSEADAERVAKEKFRDGVRNWLSSDDIGQEACVLFCAHILAKIGKYEKARRIRTYLASLPAIVSPFSGMGANFNDLYPLTRVYRGLAMWSTEESNWNDAITWLDREIKIYSILLEVLQGQQEDEEVTKFLADVRWKLTGAMLNMAAAHRNKGERPKARQMLEQVLKDTEDAKQKSCILCSLALIALEERRDPNEILKLTRKARALAPGRAESQFESYGIEAQMFLAAGAYDNALEAIDAGLDITKLYGALGFQCQLLGYKLDVYLRRNDLPCARATVEELLQSADAAQADGLGASIRIELIPHLKPIPALADLADQMLLWLEKTLPIFPDDDPRVQRYRALKERLFK